MESALVALISIALLLYGGLMMVRTTLSSADTVAGSMKEMQEREGDRARTEIALGAATLNAGKTLITVPVHNDGQVSFHDFDNWDVIVQYYDAADALHVLRAGRSSDPPGDGNWTSLDPTPVTYQPGILNPGEQMQVKVQVSPAIKAGTNYQLVVATSNGVTASRTYAA